eukprot:6176099-Pleurochrysis_carterae.AAC.1
MRFERASRASEKRKRPCCGPLIMCAACGISDTVLARTVRKSAGSNEQHSSNETADKARLNWPLRSSLAFARREGVASRPVFRSREPAISRSPDAEVPTGSTPYLCSPAHGACRFELQRLWCEECTSTVLRWRQAAARTAYVLTRLTVKAEHVASLTNGTICALCRQRAVKVGRKPMAPTACSIALARSQRNSAGAPQRRCAAAADIFLQAAYVLGLLTTKLQYTVRNSTAACCRRFLK